jgi:hypothetical protein
MGLFEQHFQNDNLFKNVVKSRRTERIQMLVFCGNVSEVKVSKLDVLRQKFVFLLVK